MEHALINGVTVLFPTAVVASEQDALDLIGEAMGAGADLVALPVGQLAPEFFTLRSGLAGAVAQKFVNYRIRLAVLGDLVSGSDALADFVRESNRGDQLWFLPDRAALEARLTPFTG